MFKCSSCGADHTDGPKCSVCKCQYDFQCAGVTETGFRRLGTDRIKNWRCPKCKSSPSPTPAATSPMPSPSPTQLDNIQEQLNKIMFQLVPLTSLVEDVKSIKSELARVIDSLNMAHDNIHELSGTVKTLESRVVSVEKVVSEVPVLREQVAKLNQALEDREQWARSNNVEIRGIPQKQNENLFEIALNIGRTCDYPVNKEQINYIARIPTRTPNADKPIIISFNNRYVKEEFVANARRNQHRNLSNIGFSSSGTFYVNDHLTQFNKNLLTKAKSLAKENNFRYVWVKHSKIMVRKSETSPLVIIKNEKDLLKII